MKFDVCNIIPAAPGWFAVYEQAGDLFVASAVIAWYIEVERVHIRATGSNEPMPRVFAVESEGNTIADNIWGYLRPDGKVESWSGLFDSIDEARVCAKEEAEEKEALRKSCPSPDNP
jgi:hypothetical protein